MLRWNGSIFELLSTTDPDITSCTDTSLTAKDTYAYFIAAVNYSGGVDPVRPTTWA